MFRYSCLSTLAATLAAAVMLSAYVLITTDPALAGEGSPSRCAGADCLAPHASRSRTPRLETRLDAGDEIATLKAVQVALSEVGDGATYVWHRRNGRISGSFQPVASFVDAGGKVCRNLKIMLASGTFTRTIEGVACRQPDGVWSLGG